MPELQGARHSGIAEKESGLAGWTNRHNGASVRIDSNAPRLATAPALVAIGPATAIDRTNPVEAAAAGDPYAFATTDSATASDDDAGTDGPPRGRIIVTLVEIGVPALAFGPNRSVQNMAPPI